MVHDRFANWRPRVDKIEDYLGVEIFMQRDDLMDPIISGNKVYKLRKNLGDARTKGINTILTFGGAFSNHIAATAQICREQDIRSVGIIRGERPQHLNPTLHRAEENGMELVFVSRGDYRRKNDPSYLQLLSDRYGEISIIQEGGANWLGIEGARGMVFPESKEYDAIVVAVGTGTTLAGIAMASQPTQRVIGIPIHKHATVYDELCEQFPALKETSARVEIRPFPIGGYAKWSKDQIEFIRNFYQEHHIKLDPIYTSKAYLGLRSLIEQGKIESGARVLFIHTGGLQGIEGFEQRFNLQLFPS